MKLKRYIQFLKESLKEDIEEKSLWRLTEQDIEEYMLEITDAGYNIEVQFGFSTKLKGEDEYTNIVKSGEKATPAYWIQISQPNRVLNVDVTSAFQFACSIISEEANAEIIVRDRDGILDKDAVEINGGLFIDGDLEAEDYIVIFAKSKEEFFITDVDLAKYYNWADYIIKEDKIYVEIVLGDMINIMLDPRSDYREYLEDDTNLFEQFCSDDYEPDTISMFNYVLDEDNQHLLVKSLIKESGGLKDFINYIGDECDDEVYKDVINKSEEEVISYLLNERFYYTIDHFSRESDIFQKVRQTIADCEMNAHIESTYQSILKDFDRIVSNEFQFTKKDKEVTGYYINRDAEGNESTKEYKLTNTFYNIPYDNDWISNGLELSQLHDKNLIEIFKEWCDYQDFRYKLTPYIPDQGHVDSKALNKQIKNDLERYLKE